MAPMRPNFILLLADDMGWGDVSWNAENAHNPGAGGVKYDVNPPRTPNLDEMATGPNTILFHRYYAGSAVCSPTRASSLTGRTSNRECVGGAEGCGQEPAWTCANNLPMSPRTFTIAKAAKAKGYATTHIGKWHLGNFFPKPGFSKHDFANNKWPVSSPRVAGFDEWHSTEASASSSLCNCGCDPAWTMSPAGDAPPAPQGVGCITGGGNFTTKPYPCTNYWSPTDLDSKHLPTNAKCATANLSTLTGCVANMTTKITGNDNVLIMDLFEDFLTRKAPGGSEASPFLAVIWLHTNHVPHPAMPEWYHAYKDVYGEPAGDYLGTLSQMDQQIGRLRSMLKTHGVAKNTALWFTADNGPHTEGGGGCSGPHARSSDQATNGLRQCKASLFEGGIRTPGFLEWPAMIGAHRETFFPTYVSDYLPTFLDALGMVHPDPTWFADGISLMPLLAQARAQEVGSALVVANRSKPLGFALGSQRAWIDNEWKVVEKAVKGQCKTMLPPYTSGKGTYLFNLVDDPTESHDVSQENPVRFAAMTAALDAWSATILVSQRIESQCEPSSPSPGPSPGPVPPMPPTPPSNGVQLKVGTQCLVVSSLGHHALVMLGDCTSGGSKWILNTGKGPDVINAADASGQVLKWDAMDHVACKAGDTIFTGKDSSTDHLKPTMVTGEKNTIILRGEDKCETLCAVVDAKGATLQDCGSATKFTIVS